jgi:hypothetical protein
MTMTILSFSIIPSHGVDASKNQIHNGIDFSQGIDSVVSMPGVLKSLKIQAQTKIFVLFSD